MRQGSSNFARRASAVDPKRPVGTAALDMQRLSDQYRVDYAVAMDIGDWLRSLGRGQHETAFRENSMGWMFWLT
jgi:hypothetical protein